MTNHWKCLRPVTAIVAILFAGLAMPAVAGAQSGSAPSYTGFQPNRDYLALQPFEAIDTAAGNLILRFVDLDLPGNAGFNLTVERVYNAYSKGWQIGISGMPMRVFERAVPTTGAIDDTISGHRAWTPWFLMPDGAAILTTFEQTPVPSSPSTLRWVAAPNFWRYDRDDNVLYLPNGRVAQFDEQGRLTSMRDAYFNVIDLSYEDDRLIVTQTLSKHESREVAFDMNPATNLPTKMAYGGHEWHYRYLSGQPVRLERFEPPAGAPWTFEYEDPTHVLTRITTPHAGVIRYFYDWKLFQTGANPQTDVEAVYVLQTRRVEGVHIEPGTWGFDYGVLPGGAVSGMTITLPSGVSVTYNYQFDDLGATPQVLAGAWMLAVRTVSLGSGGTGTVIEREGLHYERLRPGRSDKPWVVPQISRRVTTRAGRSYTTEYQYSSNLSTFHDYHRPIRIRERGPGEQLNREVALTYTPVSDLVPFIAGLPATETVTAAGRTVSRSWSYEAATGFRTAETQYGITTTFERGEGGNVQLARKANDNWTRYSYRYGQVETVTSSEDGYGVTRAINPDGTIASETQAGRTTSYTYDALSRPEFVYPPGYPTYSKDTKTTYDERGNPTTTRGSYQVVTTLDGFGRPVATESGDHQAGDTIKTRQRYDAEGRVIFTSLPYTGGGPVPGLRTCYDALGRVVREEHLASHDHVDAPCDTPLALAYRAYTYDDAAHTVVVRDENGHTATRTYQAFGHPDDAQLVTLADQDHEEWRYRYDVFGNLAEVRAPDGLTRTWFYNDKNLLEDETHPEWGAATAPQPGTAHYEYDAAGVLRFKRDAGNQTISYTYDDADRLRQIDGPGTAIRIEYERGSDNRRLIAADGTESRLHYDPAGRLAVREDRIDERPFVTQFEYDVHDNLARVIYPTSARSIRYGHDRHNRVSHVVDENSNATLATEFRYHASGALAGYVAGNGVATVIEHDPFRYWVTDVVVRTTAPTNLLHVEYRDPDPMGNMQRVRVSRYGATTADETFSYDALGRLSVTTGPSSQEFRYDVHGNRIGDATGNGAFEYDARKRLRRFITVPMDYDNNGNLTSRSGDTFTYTATNWLRTATVPGRATTYRYDGDGLRLKKETAGAAPVYYTRDANSRLLSEFVPGCPTGRIKQYVYAGAHLIAVMAADINADDCGGGGPEPDPDPDPDPGPGPWLLSGGVLSPGDVRRSPSGQYLLAYQGDGNLVLYDGPTDIWSTATQGTSPGHVVMQGDGHLIVKDAAGEIQWKSCTAGHDGAALAVHSDGQLAIYSAAGTVLWDRVNNQTGAPACQP